MSQVPPVTPPGIVQSVNPHQADANAPTSADGDDSAAYVRGMERLIDAVRDLASARTLEEIAEVVRHAARDLSRADGATFVLREQGHCYYMDEDAIAPLWRGLRFPMETCISGWAMLHKQGVVIPDIYLDDRIPHDAYRPTFVQSLAISPIRTTDPIGAIGSYWASHHQATSTELRLLQALADSTAVALESVRVLSDLEDRVAERTEQLAIINRDLQFFAATAAHDLRSPVTTIAGYAGFLQNELQPDEGTVGLAVTAIERSSKRLLTLIDELLVFARSGSSDPVTSTVDLDDLVRDSLLELADSISESGAQISTGALGTAVADGTLLRQALQNLVSNAITYVRDGVPPQVRIDATRHDGTVTIRVSDNGPGVPPGERTSITRPFARGSTAGGRTGTGLGLAICERVAAHHGGTLSVADSPHGGTEFAITLPDVASGDSAADG